MFPDPADFIACGQIVKIHGVQGAMKLDFLSHFSPSYQERDWLFVEFHKKPVPFLIESIEYQGDGLPVVKIRDVDTPEKARNLLNKTLLFPKSEIPESRQEALLVYQLDQFALYNAQGAYVGIVRDVIDHGYQFLLEVEKPNQVDSLLVPFHQSLVHSINQEAKSVSMEIPEGLEDL